jgi:hypothetical protein
VNLAISAYLTTGDLQASAPVDFPIAQRVQVEERDPGVEGLRPPLYGGFMTSGWPKAWYCLWDEPERVLGRVTLTHSAEHAISKNAVSTALVDSQGN